MRVLPRREPSSPRPSPPGEEREKATQFGGFWATKRVQATGNSRPEPQLLARTGGFTLLEVLLAMCIAVGILTVVLFFYQQCAALRSRLLLETSRISAVRLVMERLTEELNAARRNETWQQGLTGASDSLQFLKLEFPSASSWSNAMDTVSAAAGPRFELISYSLDSSTNGEVGAGLTRSEGSLYAMPPAASTNALDEPITGATTAPQPAMVIEQIQFLRLRYWDGTQWLDAWTTPDLPAGVEVTLGIDPLPPELTPDEYPYEFYRRVIYLPNHGAARPPQSGTMEEGV